MGIWKTNQLEIWFPDTGTSGVVGLNIFLIHVILTINYITLLIN